MTLAEAINLLKSLESVPEDVRPQPDVYHARTGHVLPKENSRVYSQLIKTANYAEANSMKINFKKTKVMLFNPCTSIDFMPELDIDNKELEVVEEMRLLGVIIRSDMKWRSNTDNMITKVNKKLWILRRLKYLGAKEIDLVDIYTKQIRSIVELAVPAWHGAITIAEQIDLERIQKCAAHIILGEDYDSYRKALLRLDLKTLHNRREKLCLKFGKKSEKDLKFQKWFKPASNQHYTRQEKFKYRSVFAKHSRFWKSPIAFLTRRLNEYHSRK